MLYRKPVASTSIQIVSPIRITLAWVMVRMLLSRFGHFVSKLRKSCRPSRYFAARIMASVSSGLRQWSANRHRNGSCILASVITYRYIFRSASLFAQNDCGTTSHSRTHTSSGKFALMAFTNTGPDNFDTL